jgi:hypothetical protein
MNPRSLVFVTAGGAVAQLAMVIIGHFAPFVREHGFAVGGMLISLVAGAQYVSSAKGGWGSSLIGGAITGGLCALIGIALSFALGDVPADILLFGTLGSTVTGALGGAARKWSLSMRKPVESP